MLPLPDYPNKPFYTVQKLIHFRVQKSGLTTAMPKLDATCTGKGFLAFTFCLNLQFQMLGFNSNIKTVMTSFQNIISVLKTLVATFTTSEFYIHKRQQWSVSCWFRGPHLKRHLNTHWSPAINTQTSNAHSYLFPIAMLFMHLISAAQVSLLLLMGPILLAHPSLQGVLTSKSKSQPVKRNAVNHSQDRGPNMAYNGTEYSQIHFQSKISLKR